LALARPGCTGVAPTAFANAHRLPLRTPPGHFTPELIYQQDLRGFPWHQLVSAYDLEGFACWADAGDQVAQLGLAYKLAQGGDPAALDWAARAAAPAAGAACGVRPNSITNICGDAWRAGRFECACGLPEAQYLEALLLTRQGTATTQQIEATLGRALTGGESRASGPMMCIAMRLDIKTCIPNTLPE